MLRFADPGGRMYTSVGTSSVNLLAHWTQATNSVSSWSVSASNGRTTGSCLRCALTNGAQPALQKTLDSQATWGVALALRTSALPGASETVGVITLLDTGSVQIDVRYTAAGAFTITRNGTVLGTSSPVLSLNSWVHLELKATIHPSAGTAVLYLNGVAIIGPLTGLNTRSTANSTANTVAVGHHLSYSINSTVDFDDIVVYDAQTTDAAGNPDITGPIGDCHVEWLLPTGAGTTTQFTPDTGSNYARVNEATPDTTSYVESSTVGNIDTYATADLAASTASVKALALCHYAKKTDTGSRQMGAVLRTASTNYVHPTGIDLTDSYLYSFRSWGSNPNTTSAWTVANINGIEIGQKVNS